MTPIICSNFNAATVTLEGSNLIEASAGTGKTYSIALLTLRLLIEKNIPIQQILMVTFTKAAVAELELRVRAFVRLGLKASRGETIADNTIAQLITSYQTALGQAVVTERLTQAQLFLDETSVLTIHSFCQKVIGEFSFETGLPFGATLLSPDDLQAVVDESFYEFWRKHITTLPKHLLTLLLSQGLSQYTLMEQIKNQLSGKLPKLSQPYPNDFLSPSYLSQTVTSIDNNAKITNQLYDALEQYLIENQSVLIQKCAKNRYAKPTFEPLLVAQDWAGTLETIYNKQETQYVTALFDECLTQVLEYYAELGKTHVLLQQFQIHLAIMAYKQVHSALQTFKRQRAVITFDDMIDLLHQSVTTGLQKESLIAQLRTKYQAVFIDEFQDTDQKQYAIFNTLYGYDNHILFYIGDPKQSIYGFRSADIFTYFEAAQQVQRLHQMNVNHRSSASFISAMNSFFLPEPNFNTFATEGIQYLPVESPPNNTKGDLHYEGAPLTPISIVSLENKEAVLQGTIAVARDLLCSGKYTIVKHDGSKQAVQPADIGILVRNKKQGIAIKQQLANYGIPAITISDTKLLQSAEAHDLYYVMLAVWQISRANINRALISELGGYTTQTLLEINEEDVLQQFKLYQEAWNSEGVYVMLRKFLADHAFTDLLNGSTKPNAERTISNILQLVEIIHKVAQRKRYTPEEQIVWLKKGMEGRTGEGDEYEQRIESDEAAVKIVTIHKSKGLEYNIVLAPHLDMLKNEATFKTATFRNPTNSRYYTAPKAQLSPEEKEWFEQQNEQENSRLLYVAITRARYHCFIAHNKAGFYKSSVLKKFVLPKLEQVGIAHITPPEIEANTKYTFSPNNSPIVPQYANIGSLQLTHLHWTKASYTMLSPEHTPQPTLRFSDSHADAYETFIFKDLQKGAHTGNLLHYLFEYAEFTLPSQWPSIINKALKRLLSSQSNNTALAENLLQLLHIATQVQPIPHQSFCLGMLHKDQRLNELEFYFPLQPHSSAAIEALSTPNIPFHIKHFKELEGMMHGKIDLFFEYRDKYYILDWKSNYLGPTLADYETSAIQASMNQNNYHLQYHIYTLAVCKYLALRKPNFTYQQHFGGVIYLYVRGLRPEKHTGIFFHKPDEKVLQQFNQLLTQQPWQ